MSSPITYAIETLLPTENHHLMVHLDEQGNYVDAKSIDVSVQEDEMPEITEIEALIHHVSWANGKAASYLHLASIELKDECQDDGAYLTIIDMISEPDGFRDIYDSVIVPVMSRVVH